MGKTFARFTQPPKASSIEFGPARARHSFFATRTERDPVKLFADWLTGQNLIDRAQLDQMQSEVKTEVDKAVEFAVAAPYPNPDKVGEDIYA
jgi:TPP-dependent pyruvate/acetoin dehydrogenase alpha subunit